MLNTGFKDLDDILGGIKRKEVIILTGYRSVGKTTFIVDVINNIAKQTTGKILYFCTSKSKLDESLLERINMSNVEFINDPNITMEKIKLKCEEEIKNDLVLVVVDLAQYINSKELQEEVPYETILEEDKHISEVLNSIATELDIPVIGAFQLHRYRITKAAAEDINVYDYEKVLNLNFDKHFPTLYNSNKRIFLHRDNRYKNKNMFTGNVDIKEVSVINGNILVYLK